MARLIYTPNALANIERLFEFLADTPDLAETAVEAVRSAIQMLEHHPLIGRIVRDDYRELVISFGRTGYLALYRYIPSAGIVRVLAIRHQREVDYPK